MNPQPEPVANPPHNAMGPRRGGNPPVGNQGSLENVQGQAGNVAPPQNVEQQQLRGQFGDNNAEEVVPDFPEQPEGDADPNIPGQPEEPADPEIPGQLAGDQQNIPPQDGHQDNQAPAQQPAAVRMPPIGPPIPPIGGPMPLAWMPRIILRPFVMPRPNFVELKRITRPRKFFQMPGRKME